MYVGRYVCIVQNVCIYVCMYMGFYVYTICISVFVVVLLLHSSIYVCSSIYIPISSGMVSAYSLCEGGVPGRLWQEGN